MRYLLPFIFACAAGAVDNHYELDVFGLSRHSNHENNYNEVNPGFALGMTKVIEDFDNSHLDMLATAGGYKDSYNAQARFVLLGCRWVYAERVSADVSAGYFQGSAFDGKGVVPTVGVRVAGPVWLHLSGDPRHAQEGATMVCAFLRIEFCH